MKQSTLNAICASLGMQLPESLILAVYEDAGLHDVDPGMILSDAYAGYLTIISGDVYRRGLATGTKTVNTRWALWYFDGEHEGVKEIDEPGKDA